MTNRQTDTYEEDLFDRDDNAAVGNAWTAAGGMEIVNQTCRRGSSASGTTGSITKDSESSYGPNYRIYASLACDDTTNDPVGEVLLRFGTTDGYKVQLEFLDTGVTNLKIVKVVSGSPTTLSTLVVTDKLEQQSSTYLSVFQHLAAQVENVADGVLIQVHLNADPRPALEYTDQTYPLWRRGQNYGFGVTETSAASDIILDRIAIEALVEPDIDTESLAHTWNFKKLKSAVRTLALRDSTGGRLDDDFFGERINGANMFLADYVGRPWWLERDYTFTWKSGSRTAELPVDTTEVDSYIWDNSAGGITYPLVPEAAYRESNPTQTTGVPFHFRLSGVGRNGAPLLRCEPAPTANRSYTLRTFRRPKWMEKDEDVPYLPQQYCEALVWGAIADYSFRDTSRNKMTAADRKWWSWLRRVRRSCRRRARTASQAVIRSGFHQDAGFRSQELVIHRPGFWR